MRHYQVTSPPCGGSPYGNLMDYGPPWEHWDTFLAKNKRDAIIQAVKSESFADWVQEQRASGKPPFEGLKAELALCEHGVCFECGECEECERIANEWVDEVVTLFKAAEPAEPELSW